MTAATLLVELLTEELPPKSLATLALNFAASIRDDLMASKLLAPTVSFTTDLATPRRLAVLIPAVSDSAPAEQREVAGPSTNAAPAAIAGFAKKHGVEVGALERKQTPKGDVFVARVKSGGASLDTSLAGIVDKAIKKLPISKMMRWGSGEAQFVRPAHGLVMLHGSRVVPGKVLGLDSQASTHGHRFMSSGAIALKNADEYEAKLRDQGNVIVRLAARRSDIEKQLRERTKELGASLGAAEDTAPLLDEVTALVEHPTVYVGKFDPAYLEVPQECLILTMRQNQKYFPLFDAAGKLQPRFLIVSNMKVADPRHIIGGNERVVRPRLEDARFFYNQDRKERLEAKVPRLARVVYHNKLGSQLDRVQRIQLLAGSIARRLKADAALAERAAWLSKADLLTGMVGEFPELQGLMGRYYALHDGEPAPVAEAIEAHYRPRYAGDRIPENPVSCAVALADKLDSIAGLFGIGEQPTGEKDPFGLRRAALGVIRIIVEHRLALSLHDVINDAFGGFPRTIGQAHAEMQVFVLNRFESYLKDRGFSTLQIDAVLSKQPTQLSLVPQQLEAVKAFQALPEAESLAAANKRIVNILKQAEAKGESFSNADLKELKEPAERSLFQALQEASAKADKLFDRGDYAGYLKTFAVLKAPVDTFFDKVMVMVDHEALRRNRLALLQDLRSAMNRVADISRLAQ
jgi:glycyl-tRNA synthetase beta chain